MYRATDRSTSATERTTNAPHNAKASSQPRVVARVAAGGAADEDDAVRMEVNGCRCSVADDRIELLKSRAPFLHRRDATFTSKSDGK